MGNIICFTMSFRLISIPRLLANLRLPLRPEQGKDKHVYLHIPYKHFCYKHSSLKLTMPLICRPNRGCWGVGGLSRKPALQKFDIRLVLVLNPGMDLPWVVVVESFL